MASYPITFLFLEHISFFFFLFAVCFLLCYFSSLKNIENQFFSQTMHTNYSFYSPQLPPTYPTSPHVYYPFTSSSEKKNMPPREDSQILQNKIQEDRIKSSYQVWARQPNRTKLVPKQASVRVTHASNVAIYKKHQTNLVPCMQMTWCRHMQVPYLYFSLCEPR